MLLASHGGTQTLTEAVALFLAGTILIAGGGVRLAAVADALADRTGLGEAMAGMLLLAVVTSLPDVAATLTAAVDGRPTLAMTNIMGSAAANLAFLGLADVAYRRANLEHAAASTANLTLAALLVALLILPMIGVLGPPAELWSVHPASPLLVLAYLFGVRLVRRVQDAPMWRPLRTAQTVEDRPQDASRRWSMASLWFQFALMATATGAGGWMVMRAAESITDLTGLSASVAGGVLTAIASSLPELVTVIAAVRQGSLTMAVSNILGTNCFNMLVIAAADVAYRPGSIYHAISGADLLWGLVAILMTAVLLLGMLRRQTYGFARMGFESVLVLALYVATIAMLVLG